MIGPGQATAPKSAADVTCPNCGAQATWDPAARALACESCGARTEVPVDASALASHTLEDASKRWPDRPRRPGILRLQCAECGAVVETTPGALTARCLFCGGAAVAEATDDGRSFPPDAVLPFTVSRGAAMAGYRRWLGARWFRPRGLARRSQLESLVPVYVPAWAFDFATHTEWGSDLGHLEPDVDGGGKIRLRVKDWRRVIGELNHRWEGVLAQGSTGVPEALWRGLEPFPVAGIAPYDPRFLAGFAAERAGDPPLAAWQSVRATTEASERAAAATQVPEGQHRNLTAKVSYREVGFRQVLLPIWVAAYRYRGKVFRFGVNGATGEVAGSAPRSVLRIAAVALVVLALVSGGLYALSPTLAGMARQAGAFAASLHPRQQAPRRPTPEERARAAGLVPVRAGSGPIHLRSFREAPRDRAAAPPPP